MRYLLRFLCCWFGLQMCVAGNAAAHEFWLEPLVWRIEAGAPLQAHMKVGEYFKGDRYPYLAENSSRFDVALDAVTEPAGARSGDLPALDRPPLGDGLHSVVYDSTLTPLRYETLDKFTAFVTKEGLPWVIDAHYKRWLPRGNFIEVYRRHAKTLIGVGSAAGGDRAFGLEFEWVADSNPYTAPDTPFGARLLWRGEPFSDAQARLFQRRSDAPDRAVETLLRTDADGRVTFALTGGGQFLLNAVHMIEPSKAVALATEAVWESRWASLSFATGDGR